VSPSELEQLLFQDPMPPLRLTLASGDQIIVRQEDTPIVSDLALVLRGRGRGRMVGPPRLVSIPNIVLAETVVDRQGRGRRRP
jgi:hypothetical protein